MSFSETTFYVNVQNAAKIAVDVLNTCTNIWINHLFVAFWKQYINALFPNKF